MKYGGGRPPNNNWSDRHWSIKPGDYIHVSYYYYRSAAFEYEQEPDEKDYIVLDKKIQYNHDQGVLWDVKEVKTGKVIKDYHLNEMTSVYDEWTGQKRAQARKLTEAEVEHLTSNPFYVVDPIPPPTHPDDIVFHDPKGKYPKSGKPIKYDDPKPGEIWYNSGCGMGNDKITIKDYELWGTSLPKAVSYTRPNDDKVYRKPLDWFKRCFHKSR